VSSTTEKRAAVPQIMAAIWLALTMPV